MTYKDFIKHVLFGNYTAFVFDSPNNRFTYSSGEINDDVFANAQKSDFCIVGINDLPNIKQIILDNFLFEIRLARNVVDDDSNELKRQIDTGIAKIGYWTDDDGVDTYMLLLD